MRLEAWVTPEQQEQAVVVEPLAELERLERQGPAVQEDLVSREDLDLQAVWVSLVRLVSQEGRDLPVQLDQQEGLDLPVQPVVREVLDLLVR